MGLFSGLLRPPSSGADGFLAALREKVERDRLRAAQATAQGDPAAAMQIRARSAAIDAQRAEAKERARRARMGEQEEMPGRSGLEVPPIGDGTLDALAREAAWLPNAAHRQTGDPFFPAALGPPGVPSEIDPAMEAGPGNPFLHHGPDRFVARPVAAQEGFERQQDRSIAEEHARATGRDPNQVYREMRGLGRQETPPAPVPQNRRRLVVPAGSQPLESSRPVPWRLGGRWDAAEVERRAARAMRLYDYFIDKEGMRPEAAAGWAASAAGESDSDYRSRERGGGGYGLFQWTYPPRRQMFQSEFGHPIEQSSEEDQLAFRRSEAKRDSTLQARLGSARTAGEHAEVITRRYERPADPNVDSIDRANIAEAILALALARKTQNQR